MRIEYLRARARALRFREHIEFLKEEKRRVLISLEAEASIWDRREREGDVDLASVWRVVEGRTACI